MPPPIVRLTDEEISTFKRSQEPEKRSDELMGVLRLISLVEILMLN